MTTITLDVPQELAEELQTVNDELPELLLMALQIRQLTSKSSWSSVATSPVFSEMLDFLAGGPTPQEIIDFKVSPVAQSRLEELLEKNRESQLSSAEASELDTFQQVNHIFILLKARAQAATN